MRVLTYIQRCGARLYDDFLELRPGAAKELEDRLNDRETASRLAKAGKLAITEVASTMPHGDGRYNTQIPASLKPASQSYGIGGSLAENTDPHEAAHSSHFRGQGRRSPVFRRYRH